jgi:hypothetical protein
MKSRLPAPKTSSGLKPKAGSTLSANVIFNGRFVTAFTPLDAETAATLPQTFYRYIIDDSKADDGGDSPPASLTFTTSGQQYSVDSNGHRRALQREVVDLQQAQREQEYWEERLSQSNEIEQTALQIIQEDHESVVARDKAAAIYQMKENEMALQLAQEAQSETNSEIAQLSGNHVMSPAVEEIPEETVEAKPKRMRKRFVCRNGTWLRTKRLKRFHIGEKVVNKKGGLPAAYLEN